MGNLGDFYKFLLICILIITFSISTVSAEGNYSENDNYYLDVDYVDELNDSSWCNIEQNVNYDSDNVSLNDGWSTFTQLNTLIQLSPSGSLIELRNNYRYEPTDSALIMEKGIKVVNSITIDGNGYTINGNYKSMIFSLIGCNVVIKNTNFINAMTQDDSCKGNIKYGGAIRMATSSLDLQNCTFIDNHANTFGGAIFVGANCNLRLERCNFKENFAGVCGGAIGLQKDGNLTMYYSTFEDNSCYDRGGAICAQEIVEGAFSTFSRNSAKYGGAIYSITSDLKYCNFINNTANINGGALASTNKGYNGDILNAKQSKYFNVICRGNSAKYGGGLYIINGTVSQSTFRNNHALEHGGGIFAVIAGITESNFENNRANTNGGGAFIKEKLLTLEGQANQDKLALQYCKFINNTAYGKGGGIYIIIEFEQEFSNEIKYIEYNYFEGNVGNVEASHLYLADHLNPNKINFRYNSFIFTPLYIGSLLSVSSTYIFEKNWWGINNPHFDSHVIKALLGDFLSDNNPVFASLNTPSVLHDGINQGFSINLSVSNGVLDGELYNILPQFSSTTGIFTQLSSFGNRFVYTYNHLDSRVAFVNIKLNNVHTEKSYIIDGRGINIIDVTGAYILGSIVIGGIAATGYIIFAKVFDDNNDSLNMADSGKGTLDNPTNTIQKAIDYAQDGDIIYILPGVYSGEGNVNLNITKNLTIISPDYGDVIIDGENNSPIFNVYANHFNIYGLVIKNAKDYVVKFNNELSDSVINSTFRDNDCDVIKFNKFSNNNTIEGIFINNGGLAIDLDKSKDTLITDSFFDKNVDVIRSEENVVVNYSWFGDNEINYDTLKNINATFNNFIYLDYALSPSKYKIGDEVIIAFDLYSYDFNSNITSKYSNVNINDFNLILSSTGVVLNKTLVNFGEEVPLIFNEDSSTISVNIENIINTFYFAKEDVNLTASINSIYEGEDACLKLSYNHNATGEVNIQIGDVLNFTDTLNDTYMLYNLSAGQYSIKINYLGDYDFAPASYVLDFTVKKEINIIANNLTIYFGSDDGLEILVEDLNHTPMANLDVFVICEYSEYILTTDNNGIAKFKTLLHPGNHTVNISVFDESANVMITVLSTIISDDLEKYYKNDTQFEARFLDSKGNYLAKGTEISFTINTVTYARSILNDEGLARLNINLNPGKYIITSHNKVTGEITPNIVTVLSNFYNNHDLVKYYKNDSQYIIQLRGDRGEILAGENVIFNINGILYTKTTNETGHAKLNINLDPGEYVVTAQYRDLYQSNNITVKSIFKELFNNNPNSYSIKLLDGQGKSYANQIVKFNINGIFYESITDDSGIALLRLALMKGQYIITAMYNGLCVGETMNIGGGEF